jgi:acyl-coenzyme A thioesterase PaaI-like protein
MTSYNETLGILVPQPGEDIHHLPYHSGVLGRPGFLHGGAIAGFLASICDAMAETEGGGHDPSISTMKYLRGGRERSTYGQAVVRARTSRLLVIEASAWQEAPEKPIAIMSRTYLRRG